MSDEWYVLSGSKVRGPATAAQLRQALADGKIQSETPVRAGARGEWSFVRELPEFAAAPQTASQDGTDSVVLDDAKAAPAAVGRGLSHPLLLIGAFVVAALGGGIFTAIQLTRPSEAKNASPTAIDSEVASPRSPTHEIKTASVSPPAIVPVAKVAEIPTATKVAEITTATKSVAITTAAKTADPAPPKKEFVEAAEKTVRATSVALQDSRSGGGSDPEPRPASRDGFDIPWPSPQRDSIGEQMDWEKLDKIIAEHNKLDERWKQLRHKYQEITAHLTQVASHLQGLQDRADSVARTLDKVRGEIGDQSFDNADVFAPPETPRWVQSLAKTYTLRTGEMNRLSAQATRAVNDFNATLTKLATNVLNQKRTLARATELRDEWVRITRPFGLFTRQDFPIPADTSTRWILSNEVFAPAYLARCVAEIRGKDYDKAAEDIGLAIKRDPSWVELYALQAVLQDRAGKRADVDKSYKMIRRLKKKPAFVEVCEGIISANHHNYDGAKNKFGAAAKHDPSDPAGSAELALLLLSHPKTEMRDPAAAVEAATAACKATSWNQWWCLDVLAIAYAASGHFDRAIGCTQRAKLAAPGDVHPLLDERIAGYKKKEVPSAAVGNL